MPSVLQTLLEHLAPVGRVLHDALNKQVYLETILLKAIREAHAVTLDAIMMRLNQLRTAGELKFLEQLPPVTAAMPAIQPPPAVSVAPAAAPEQAPVQEPAPAVSVQAETQPHPEQETALQETASEQPASQEMTISAAIDNAEPSASETEAAPAPVQEIQIEVPPAPIQEMQIEAVPTAAMPVEIPPAPIPEMAVSCAEETFSATETLSSPSVEAADESDEKEEAELDISSAVKLTADIPGTPAPELSVVPKGDHLRESVINKDASALRTVLSDPDVKTLVDLFDGTVIDIHR
jgi:DNA polymerase-3 subunit gamma/tau